MYEYITGRIVELGPAAAVVEAGGIGYQINISLGTYTALEGKGEGKLLIEEVIREDSHSLYGFASKGEREVFRLLVSVSGVGPSTAECILSSFGVAELQGVILSEDVGSIKKVKGIGLKTAQRLIIELKDKIGAIEADGQAMTGGGGAAGKPAAKTPDRDEAVTALQMLGYTPADAAALVDKVLKAEPGLPVNKLVKAALRSTR